MRLSPIVLIASVAAIVLADPASAQRRKDDSQRVAPRRESTTETRDRRRDDDRTAARVPTRERTGDRGEIDRNERNDRDRDRRDRHDRYDRDRGILGPIVVLSPRYDDDRYGRRYDAYGHRRVWNRVQGMSCLQLDDELEWAHDEWHYRNDRYRGTSHYEVEHARLEWRIADERAYSGCGRARHDRDCHERGHYPRTDSTLQVAILVLDILLGGGDRGRW